MSQELGFVEVVVIATGEKCLVPPHWMDDPVLSTPFKYAPSARAKMAEDADGAAEDAPPEDPTDPAGDPPAEDPTPAPAPTTKASGKTR